MTKFSRVLYIFVLVISSACAMEFVGESDPISPMGMRSAQQAVPYMKGRAALEGLMTIRMGNHDKKFELGEASPVFFYEHEIQLVPIQIQKSESNAVYRVTYDTYFYQLSEAPLWRRLSPIQKFMFDVAMGECEEQDLTSGYTWQEFWEIKGDYHARSFPLPPANEHQQLVHQILDHHLNSVEDKGA